MKYARIKMRECSVHVRDRRARATTPATARMYREIWRGYKGELLTPGEVKKFHVPERFYDWIECRKSDTFWFFGTRRLKNERE